MSARLTLAPAAPADAEQADADSDRLSRFLRGLGETLAREQWQPEQEPPTAEPWCPDAA